MSARCLGKAAPLESGLKKTKKVLEIIPSSLGSSEHQVLISCPKKASGGDMGDQRVALSGTHILSWPCHRAPQSCVWDLGA